MDVVDGGGRAGGEGRGPGGGLFGRGGGGLAGGEGDIYRRSGKKGRGLPNGSGLGLSRCLGPGECLHSFIHSGVKGLDVRVLLLLLYNEVGMSYTGTRVFVVLGFYCYCHIMRYGMSYTDTRVFMVVWFYCYCHIMR